VLGGAEGDVREADDIVVWGERDNLILLNFPIVLNIQFDTSALSPTVKSMCPIFENALR